MISKIQLKNKLKTFFVESKKAPVVSAQVWVKTGSADETKTLEGISHFIEHLVFKGTKKFGVGEIAKAVESAGGELNAFTTFDHTVFYITISKTELRLALNCLSEMIGFPKFDEEEIDREREVVIEEIKRSFDNPQQVASQQLFSTVFKRHPYGIPIIGYEKNIRQVSKKKLETYYFNRYVPTNMSLVVTGDLDLPEAKKAVAEFFNPIQKRKLKKVSRKKEPKQRQMVYSYKLTDFKDAQLNIAVKAPPLGHKDVAALDLLGMIMGSGDSSRLVKKLRLEKPLVLSVAAGGYHPKDQGLFAFFMSLKGESVKEVMCELETQLVTAITEPVTAEELHRAKINTQSDEIYGLETVDGLARKVGHFQTLLNDPNYIQRYLEQVQKLTPLDLLKVARKYIHPKGLNFTLLLNKNEEPHLPQKEFFEISKRVEKKIKDALKQKLKIKKEKTKQSAKFKPPQIGKSKGSHVVKHTLTSGARLIFKKNGEVPTVSVRLGFLGGSRFESADQRGITTLASNTWTSGTQIRSEEVIAKEIENAAAHIGAFGGRNTIGLNFDCLKDHFDSVFEVYQDVCLNPQFPQDSIAREAQIQMHHIKTREDNPASLAMQKLMEKIFAGHPYSHDILGDEKFLSRAQSSQLKKYFGQMRTAKNTTIVVAGDFREDKIIDRFESFTRQMDRGEKMEKVFEVPAFGQSSTEFHELKKEQTHIVMGYRGISLLDPRRFSLDIIQAILAGQGGRLFLELRDKASLAYTVAPIHLNGVETGYFGAYIGCSPEKGKLAIKMLKEEFQKLTQDPLSDQELERAKRYLIGQNHIGLQRNSAQASSILFDEIYGIDGEEAFKYAEHIRTVNKGDVTSLAQVLFSAPTVTVAYGAQNPF